MVELNSCDKECVQRTESKIFAMGPHKKCSLIPAQSCSHSGTQVNQLPCMVWLLILGNEKEMPQITYRPVKHFHCPKQIPWPHQSSGKTVILPRASEEKQKYLEDDTRLTHGYISPFM